MRLRTTLTVLATAGLTVVLAGPAGAADLNCSDFATQAQAQAVLDANPADPNNLDQDGDGIACESLPAGGTEDGTTFAANGGAQVATRPQGAVAAGDGSSTGGPGVLPYAVGGLALVGAAGAGLAARRSARATA